MSELELKRVALDHVPWSELDAFADRTVFQRRAWLSFLTASQTAEPVVAALVRGRETVGWYTGGIVRRFGVKFLGSPLRGWTTSYMGFNLATDRDLDGALAALRPFAFRELGCVHCEVMDRRSPTHAGLANGYRSSTLSGFEIDLTQTPEQLIARMNQARRHAIRRAPRNGVTVEQAHGLEFADEHYAQLCDVFAKQSLPPPYAIERLRQLIRNLEPSGDLLLARARGPDGKSIATGIFPAYNRMAHFWMGASWRSGQKHLPNEALQWFAINHWRDRGIAAYDMGGGGDYKAKYGGKVIEVGWLRSSRFDVLERVRAELFTLRKRVRQWRGRRAKLR
jgi:hypothetical protein